MDRIEISKDNVCIDRIEEKCIHCGMCLETCKKINCLDKDCINCGQCLLTCPSGALIPKYNYQSVLNYINDTDYITVAFTSPAVRVAIGDEFGYPSGSFLEGKMVGVLRKLGFSYVFDTTFGADLTIMEEANELVNRIKNKKLPLFTSCCPSWVLYMNKYHPKDIDKLSTCKSPIAMEATIIKTYFAQMYNIPKEKIKTIAITPCVSKKYERIKYPETDFVITTRELAIMIKQVGIDFASCKDDKFDALLDKGSSAGLIFGASGGVTEAVLRTAYYMINRSKAPEEFYNLKDVRGELDFKEANINMGEFNLKVAVVNKLSTINKYYDTLQDYDFVEVMTCPGGCIGGGGQPLVPIKDIKDIREKRMASIYLNDQEFNIKESYMNTNIQDLYISYLSKKDIPLHVNFTKINK